MSSSDASATGPRVLFVYFTYTRQNLKVDGGGEAQGRLAEAQAGMGVDRARRKNRKTSH